MQTKSQMSRSHSSSVVDQLRVASVWPAGIVIELGLGFSVPLELIMLVTSGLPGLFSHLSAMVAGSEVSVPSRLTVKVRSSPSVTSWGTLPGSFHWSIQT